MSKAKKQSQALRTGTVKIADVARLAGCAPATVSRRLNDPKMVSESVIQAIDAAIDKLGYVRNASARALRSSRTRLIGAVIPTLRHSIYAQMISGLQQTLSANGFALIHSASSYDLDEEYEQVCTLVERGVEAVVLVGTRHRAKTFDLLTSRKVSCVTTYALQDGFRFTSVGFDNHRAAELAANTLLDLGHTRFAMIAGKTHNNDRAQARVDGFLDALAARGIDRESVIVCEASYLIEEGRAAMEQILMRAPDVTALFCGSDILAVGAMFECRSRSISVPADLSIIGFDNLEISAYTDPPLSTLNVPAFAMGEEAANYLVRADHQLAPVKKVELQVDFIERGTTGPAPQRRRSESEPSSQQASVS
jgi:LacI family transcriptional regulator